MNDTKLRDYLFSDHYKAWPVQEAIKPNIDYQQWTQDSSIDTTTVVIAFGSKSGQTVSRLEAEYFKIFPIPARPHDAEYYYVHKSEVFFLNNPSNTEQTNPHDYMLCKYRGEVAAFHPEDVVLTEDNRWLAKKHCRELCPDYYWDDDDNPIWIDYNQTRETHDGEIIKSDDAVYCESDCSWYHTDNDELFYNEHRDYWVHPDDDDVRWCIDVDEYTLTDDCYYCNMSEEWYYYENNLPQRDHTQSIQEYHCCVEPTFHIQPIDKNKVLSKYTIGFEVEKDCLRDGNQEAGSFIEQQPLFSHWETDSSCGIEGITNVYSLDNAELFINHVRASDYTNLDTNQKCGGHINFAHRENKLQYWHIRPWLGLIFSMWKKRLTNTYSSCNKKLNPYRGTDYHYGALVEKGRMRNNTRFELRLPNKVKDGDTLIRRFCLIQKLIECVDLYINEDFSWMSAEYDDDNIIGIPNWITDNRYPSHDDTIANLITTISPQTRQRTRFFFDKAKSIIMQGYAPEEYKRVLIFAYAFQSYIDEETPSGVVTELTNPYINN